jgi:hypothetical protein
MEGFRYFASVKQMEFLAVYELLSVGGGVVVKDIPRAMYVLYCTEYGVPTAHIMLIDRLSLRMSNNSTNETFDLSYDEGDDAQMTHRVNNNDNKSLVDEGQLTEISDHLHPLIHLSSRDLIYLE